MHAYNAPYFHFPSALAATLVSLIINLAILAIGGKSLN